MSGEHGKWSKLLPLVCCDDAKIMRWRGCQLVRQTEKWAEHVVGGGRPFCTWTGGQLHKDRIVGPSVWTVCGGLKSGECHTVWMASARWDKENSTQSSISKRVMPSVYFHPFPERCILITILTSLPLHLSRSSASSSPGAQTASVTCTNAASVDSLWPWQTT